MKILLNTDQFNGKKHTAVGLGMFDGLHIGHMELINRLIEQSRLNKLDSVVFTFKNHPENTIKKTPLTKLLTTERQKIEILSKTDLDYVIMQEFDEGFSHVMPEDFVRDILVNKLGIKLAVVGFNYRFGYRGQGDVNLLKTLGNKYNFDVVVIPPVMVDNELVSSTLIRNYISKGQMEKVFKLLGRYYSIDGIVEEGKRLGSELGFPTANIYPHTYLVLPMGGVYITKTIIDGKEYGSITNVGVNPTVENSGQVKLETHIINFSQNVYNREIEVFFIKRMREEKRFSSKEELVEQISEDLKQAVEFFKL
ncbi:MAG TPA: bifunctional riboflavin kinase/FAD synthetase [Clostridiaceae bacterium]|nr:bifunctional riboflavin kinase/FAD synthetase [Clostridiaceae bacterium]